MVQNNASAAQLPAVEDQPRPYGILHPTLQQVDSPIDGAGAPGLGPGGAIQALRDHLGPDHDPVGNWAANHQTKAADANNTSTWFPCDDQVAFYTPKVDDNHHHHQQQYDTLTYRELHQEMAHCPAFVSHTAHKKVRVALVIPADDMALSAMATLSVLSQSNAVAVPLDPRMPTMRILDAMEQLNCTALITTDAFLATQGNFLLKHQREQQQQQPEQPLSPPSVEVVLDGDKNEPRPTVNAVAAVSRDNECLYTTHPSLLLNNNTEKDIQEDPYTAEKTFFANNLQEIRVVCANGPCGRMNWTCLSRSSKSPEEWVVQSSPELTITTTPISSEHSDDDDVALLLRTSGTTSRPKVVPISKSMLLYGGISIAAALRLKRDDCNANVLPFTHIGGISCQLLAVLTSGSSVLLLGPMAAPNDFLDHLLGSGNTVYDPKVAPSPTWYYAGPWLHKAIIPMAEARYNANGQQPLKSRLRFIRNAQSHVNHAMILRLSTVFGVPIIPTYGMTEAMPITFSSPMDVARPGTCDIVDQVGFSLTSLKIVSTVDGDDGNGERVLEHSTNTEERVGEVCVKGAGVISRYLGVDPAKTHTKDGWIRTGDLGMLDRQGRLFIKGRSKEMIKRGGEQVWPNEIDDVVEKVPGVVAACAFGVPNELWGEEVAVAVVLADTSQMDDPSATAAMKKLIMQTCSDKLDKISQPHQVKFLCSTKEFATSSSGKYMRSKMADHLGVKAVDTRALQVITTASQMHAQSLVQAKANEDRTLWEKLLILLETKSEEGHRVIPSDALNGVRFLVTLFVVQVHVGLFPNLTWVKLQGYFPNMMIFFSLAGFQATCQVARSVKGQWAHFVGTKIGALHSLYVISQLFTFPSYVLFRAFDEQGNLIWDAGDWVKHILLFIFCTVTGLGHKWNVNMFTWFQSTFYLFLALFPFIDDYLRRLTLKRQGIWFVVAMVFAGALWAVMYVAVPTELFWGDLYPLGWSIVTWLPLLVSSMIAAYFFRRLVEYYYKKKQKELADSESQEQSDDPNTIRVEQVIGYTALWGHICDACSLVLLAAWITVALFPNCLCVYEETFEAMRPEVEVEEYGCPWRIGLDDYVWTCDITYNEWTDYIQPDPNHFDFGRFVTNFSGAFGYLRCSAPIYLLWCSTMAFGTGYTSRIFASKMMQRLAPLGYPVYLLHLAVTRYYWVATRGLEKQYWWGREGEFPFPVEWWEFFLVTFVSIAIGGLVNAFLVPSCLPYTISWGVRVCTGISRGVATCAACVGIDLTEKEEEDKKNGEVETATYKQLRVMIRGLTGMEVTKDLPLNHLGLDSLGATALLGTLRSTVPAANTLTLRQLQECDTVGSLHEFLDGGNSTTAGEPSGASSQAGTASDTDEKMPS